MMNDSDPERMRRLERKVDNLTWMLGLQTALLAVFAFSWILQISRYLVLVFLIAVPTLVVFRRSLPTWGRRIGLLRGLWDRRRVKVDGPRS